MNEQIIISSTLAKLIGLNEAIIYEKIYSQTRRSQDWRDGHIWLERSFEEWHEELPFLDIAAIKKAIGSLINQKIIVSGYFAEDETTWYTFTCDNAFDNSKLTRS